jgi:hypothetical protein
MIALTVCYCPDENCPFEENIEVGSTCPRCGEHGQPFNFLTVNDLFKAKRKNNKLKEKLLFDNETVGGVVLDKLNAVLREIAKLESKSFSGDSDDTKTLILLVKAQVLEGELVFRELALLTELIKRLLGIQ